jgi:hypothetical protein
MDMPQKQLTKEAVIAQVQELIQTIDKANAAIWDRRVTYWRSLVGDRLEEMLRSPSFTKALATHNDPIVRLGALSVLSVCISEVGIWPPERSDEVMFKHIALHDSDPDVQGAALSCLAGLYASTNDKSIIPFLIGIGNNSKSGTNLRNIAYIGVFRIRGKTIPESVMQSYLANGAFPDDLDWSDTHQ